MNGLKTRLHLGEIQRLLKEYEPVAICLQHVSSRIHKIGNYFLASSSVPTNDTLGTAIYVHNKIMYDIITFQTSELQISAIKIYFNKNYYFNLYNVYNQPNCNYNLQNIKHVLTNVRDNFLLVGDFNAHNPLWNLNLSDADNNGKILENFVEEHNLCILNDPEMNTYYSKTHGTFSSIDVSVCSVNIVDRLEWFVLDDLYTSDHYPIMISCLVSGHTEKLQHYNTEKADWVSYQMYTGQISPFDDSQDHNVTNDFIVEFMTNAADKTIPKTTNHSVKHSVPWWSATLNQLIKEKTTIGRRLDTLNNRFKKLSNKQIKLPTVLNKMVDISLEISLLKPHFNKISAKFRKEVINGKIVSS